MKNQGVCFSQVETHPVAFMTEVRVDPGSVQFITGLPEAFDALVRKLHGSLWAQGCGELS